MVLNHGSMAESVEEFKTHDHLDSILRLIKLELIGRVYVLKCRCLSNILQEKSKSRFWKYDLHINLLYCQSVTASFNHHLGSVLGHYCHPQTSPSPW